MIDELNNLEHEVIPIDEYFKVMDLTKEQIEEREEVAEKLNDVLLFLFSLILINKESGLLSREYILTQFRERYTSVLADKMVIDDYMEQYITDITGDIVEATYRNIETEYEIGDFSEENSTYWLSDGRAIIIAENEANTSLNYNDFVKAVKNGYTKKVWRTERDNRVRKTHKKLENKAIPIKELFVVGNTLMRFPKDTAFGDNEREIINCRCSVKYLK